MNSKTKLLVAVGILLPILVVVQFAGASDANPNVLRAFLVTNSHTCNANSGFDEIVYVTNRAEWPANPNSGFLAPSSRNTIGNSLLITGYGLSDGPAPVSPPSSITWSTSITGPGPIGGPIGVTWTANWAITSNSRPDRQNPIVLPGETTAVLYYGIECTRAAPGNYQDIVTLVGTFNGQSVTLTTPPISYTVTAG